MLALTAFRLPATRAHWALPSLSVSYLMPGREAAPTLVPGDLGMSLPRNKAVQIQTLPFRHVGGRRFDSDRRDDPEC